MLELESESDRLLQMREDCLDDTAVEDASAPRVGRVVRDGDRCDFGKSTNAGTSRDDILVTKGDVKLGQRLQSKKK